MVNPNHRHPAGATIPLPIESPISSPIRDCLKLRKSVPDQRGKAIFTSLAAAFLILAAQTEGLSTSPTTGWDEEK